MFGESHAAIVGFFDQMDHGRDAFPCHGPCPSECLLNAAQQRPVPVIFQDAPATFDQVVFAVIGGIVNQFDFQVGAVAEFDHSFHELGARTVDLGAVVQIDLQTTNVRMDVLSLGPPQIETVGHEVAGVAGGSKHDGELIRVDV